MQSPFIFTPEEYTRDLDIIGNAQITVAKYISLKTSKDYDQCYGWAKKKITKDSLKNPDLKALVRQARGDRQKAKIPYLTYLERVEQTGRILTPNMVCYSNPKDEKSVLSDFIGYNMDRRSAIKKEGQAAEMAKDYEYAAYCNREQGNTKFFNNSMSGAMCSAFNALVNPSAHTSLTSACRSVTSYANSLIEKFLGGLRHYYSIEVTKADIAFLATRCDVEAIERCVKKFNLQPVTVDYAVEQITRSASQYWSSEQAMADIRTMLENLSEYELMGFVLTGDWRAFTETQDSVMRELYTKLMERPTVPHPDPDSVVKSADDDIKAMVGLLSSDYLAGRTVKDLKKDDPHMYGIYASTMEHVYNTLVEYTDLFQTFVSFKYLTTGIHSYPSANRTEVIASDTDSAIFTTRRFIKWFAGSDGFELAHTSVAAITAYITSQLVAHALALLSKQMGVPDDLLYKLTMKMEFYIPVMTTVATKTYAMVEAAKEGNVFSDPHAVIKGVLLKSSKVPPAIARVRDEYYNRLLLSVYEGKTFTPKEIMAPIAALEHIIFDALKDRETFFFKSEQIKTPDSYKNPESSPYAHYKFWNAVFGEKYGTIDALPIEAIKVNVDLPNKTRAMQYFDTLPEDIKKPMLAWYDSRKANDITNFIIPKDLLPGGKLPPELQPAVNKGRLVSDVLGGMYLMATGFGVHVADKHMEYYASDIISEEEANALSFIDVYKLLAG